jgi:hypothetical protein
MHLFEKFLIMTILVISCIVLYNLTTSRSIMQRSSPDNIFKQYDTFSIMGFGSSAENESNTMANKISSGSGIVSLNINLPINQNIILRECCIKSSYNSACSGSYVSTNAIKYVLSRGCRFIDLETFHLDNQMVVGVSSSNIPGKQNITSTNTITLNDALYTAAVFGFSAPTPNQEDPLFIHIRINTVGINIAESGVFRLVAMDILSILKNRLCSHIVTGDSSIASIMGKIVLILDIRCAPDYKTEPMLSKLVNIESGGSDLRIYSYSSLLDQYISPIEINTVNNTSTVSNMKMILPSNTLDAAVNPPYYTFISDYGVQMIPNRYYLNDTYLKMYEEFFRDNKSAFVPFNIAVSYLRKDV